MKLLLIYFVKFEEDSKILAKKYLSDCVVRDPN